MKPDSYPMKLALLVPILASLSLAGAEPLTTAFTYGGRLDEHSLPASGNYDFRFALHDAPDSGAPLLPPIESPGVTVLNGAFSVALDFHSSFNGDRRWLEVSVRPAGGASEYTTLSPRQEITATPYALAAIRSQTAASAESVRWEDIRGIPLSLADGDDDTRYAAGAGLSLGGNTFNIAEGGIFGPMIAGGAISPDKLSPFGASAGQVLRFDGSRWQAADPGGGSGGSGVSSLNGLNGDVTLLPGANVTLVPRKGGIEINAAGATGWNTTGNLVDQGGFIGTLNDHPLELRAGGHTALRLEPSGALTPNIIAGSELNEVVAGVTGGTVGGGGGPTVFGLETKNRVEGSFSTIGGGAANRAASAAGAQFATVGGGFGNAAGGDISTIAGGYGNRASREYAAIGGGVGNEASGPSSVVPGGAYNSASGFGSFAAGIGAKALHDGTFVWAGGVNSPGTGGDFSSTAPNQFSIRAEGGIQLSPNTSLFSGTQTRQMLNLWSTIHGIGVQANTTYFRTGTRFSWFSGGTHEDGENNPGAGGSVMMTLDAGGLTVNGTFVNASDRNLKDHIMSVDPREILARVVALPLSEWEYKSDSGRARHIGPMAQDFHAAFGVGSDDRHIATVDADGVALGAIQGLNREMHDALERKEARISELENRLSRLESLLSNIQSK